MWDGTWAPVTFSLVLSTLLQTGCEALRVLATAAVRIVRRFTDNAAVNFRGRASWCPTYALLHLWNFWSGMVRVPLQQMRPDRSAVCQAHSRDVETHACESRGDVRGGEEQLSAVGGAACVQSPARPPPGGRIV